MSDMKQFKLPDVGEGLTEAEVVSWKVEVGDTVKINDVLVEIETAKSLVELPSPFAGTVAALLVDEGQTVDVGTAIISVETQGSATPNAEAPATHAGASEDLIPSLPEEGAVEPGLIGGPAPGGRTSVLVGYGPRTTEAKRRPRKGAAPVETSPAAAQVGVQHAFTPYATPAPAVDIADAEPAAPSALLEPPQTLPSAHIQVLAKPPVRKLAKDLGVDLAEVTATGEGGTITRTDVEQQAGRGVQAATGRIEGTQTGRPEGVPPQGGGSQSETRIPVKGVRKATAQAMVTSAFTAPHVTEWITVDVTRTMRMVRRLSRARDFRDVKVSPLLIVSRAVCMAIARTPALNASWDEAAQEIVVKHYVNLGIAAATPRGLVVPNIKNAAAMSGADLAAALQEVIAVARQGKTQPSEMAGGTFTITNVGVFGVDAGTPILNPGESGILAMGVIRRQPWMVGKKIKPRWVTTLALSFDHRVVDGEQGSRFLSDVAALVEDPGNSLVF
ncbi:MAG TPA: dihydrolipoamide acetyltransferase family protein [Nocardioidaceae bacterium]|nr:dihydrolipoamide acetyltransferase family protein [Nocardioidaceae bacterium]